MKQSNFKNKKAMTLAEVLITLGIIGVVASMSIPTLMNKTNYSELSAKFLKTYSTLSSAWQQLIQENGGTIVGVYTSPNDVVDAFCTKLKCIKICHSTDDRTQCFHDTNWKKLDGEPGWGSILGPGAILADGTAFRIALLAGDCNATRYKDTTCGAIDIDVNGFKNPNTFGRDIFELFFTQKKIVSQGATGTDGEGNIEVMCNSSITSTYNGASCGTKILRDGKMDY